MQQLLRKLMFWKQDTVELDYDVSGCFTLPDAAAVDEADPTSVEDDAAARTDQ